MFRPSLDYVLSIIGERHRDAAQSRLLTPPDEDRVVRPDPVPTATEPTSAVDPTPAACGACADEQEARRAA
jgi:hypothetical protein